MCHEARIIREVEQSIQTSTCQLGVHRVGVGSQCNRCESALHSMRNLNVRRNDITRYAESRRRPLFSSTDTIEQRNAAFGAKRCESLGGPNPASSRKHRTTRQHVKIGATIL